MNNIKAIPTIYNGNKFRSRLEAKWAVFFDAAGIRYQHEPEGYKVKGYDDEGKPKVYCYLPDFYLPDFDCFVEVKPSKSKLYEDEYKLNAMIDFGASPIAKGLLILGQIPPVIDFWLPSFIKYYHNKGVVADLVTIEPASTDRYGNKRAARLWTVEDCIDCTGGMDLPLCPIVGDDLYHIGDFINVSVDGKLFLLVDYEHKKIIDLLNKCFDKARQAKFEHGEKP